MGRVRYGCPAAAFASSFVVRKGWVCERSTSRTMHGARHEATHPLHFAFRTRTARAELSRLAPGFPPSAGCRAHASTARPLAARPSADSLSAGGTHGLVFPDNRVGGCAPGRTALAIATFPLPTAKVRPTAGSIVVRSRLPTPSCAVLRPRHLACACTAASIATHARERVPALPRTRPDVSPMHARIALQHSSRAVARSDPRLPPQARSLHERRRAHLRGICTRHRCVAQGQSGLPHCTLLNAVRGPPSVSCPRARPHGGTIGLAPCQVLRAPTTGVGVWRRAYPTLSYPLSTSDGSRVYSEKLPGQTYVRPRKPAPAAVVTPRVACPPQPCASSPPSPARHRG
ncbi:hypothetical protein BD413DRAFT_159118 [Trametes elegans]|nr:hypothetical protein BD413DRAFT_159118 [Trametes elegans]